MAMALARIQSFHQCRIEVGQNMMRVFQNLGIYSAYAKQFNLSNFAALTFTDRRQAYLIDRYGASQLLDPILKGEETAFFTIGNDPILQSMWARENGLNPNSPLERILLAQIEAHRTEVFYNLDPMRFESNFVRKLPGCVRFSLAWRAAPSPGADFSAYDRVVCCFPSIIESWRRLGWRTGYLALAHDPITDAYAKNTDRPLDVLFIGSYSRHHSQRAQVLESVASLSPRYRVAYCLNRSRLTRIADSPLGLLPGLSRQRRPSNIRCLTIDPVFGLELYRLMSSAKIVLNGAIDMADKDRGNMRCFEALGCGALMLSDRGNYPDGFADGETMATYRNAGEAVARAAHILDNWERHREIAIKGGEMLRNRYSKTAQWEMFQKLVE
jgi:hypothetical protein